MCLLLDLQGSETEADGSVRLQFSVGYSVSSCCRKCWNHRFPYHIHGVFLGKSFLWHHNKAQPRREEFNEWKWCSQEDFFLCGCFKSQLYPVGAAMG